MNVLYFELLALMWEIIIDRRHEGFYFVALGDRERDNCQTPTMTMEFREQAVVNE